MAKSARNTNSADFAFRALLRRVGIFPFSVVLYVDLCPEGVWLQLHCRHGPSSSVRAHLLYAIYTFSLKVLSRVHLYAEPNDA